MDIKIFSDLVQAIGEVAKSIKDLTDLPARERKNYREQLGDTFKLLDSTLTLIIIRLGDLLQIENKEDFLEELGCLNNYRDWLRLEREIRLCRNLRIAANEMKRIRNQLIGRISVKDWDMFLQKFDAIFRGENELAVFISESLSSLSSKVDEAKNSDLGLATVIDAVKSDRDSLIQERLRLITLEIDLYAAI